jgi:hypothetical protein
MDSAESRARRDRDWQVVVVGVSLVAMLIFEMFHSPPCNLSYSRCSGSEFLAQIVVNVIWATVMGVGYGIALAAVMALLVDSLDALRTRRTTAPLLRTLLGVALVIIVFVLVLVRFQFVSR